jgi:hypothetical protein
MLQTVEKNAIQLIEYYGAEQALQITKNILTMYSTSFNVQWVKDCKRTIEYIEIYIEGTK